MKLIKTILNNLGVFIVKSSPSGINSGKDEINICHEAIAPVLCLLILFIGVMAIRQKYLEAQTPTLPKPRTDVLGITAHHDKHKRIIVMHAINTDKATDEEHLVKFLTNKYLAEVQKLKSNHQSPTLVVPVTVKGTTWGFVIHYEQGRQSGLRH